MKASHLLDERARDSAAVELSSPFSVSRQPWQMDLAQEGATITGTSLSVQQQHFPGDY